MPQSSDVKNCEAHLPMGAQESWREAQQERCEARMLREVKGAGSKNNERLVTVIWPLTNTVSVGAATFSTRLPLFLSKNSIPTRSCNSVKSYFCNLHLLSVSSSPHCKLASINLLRNHRKKMLTIFQKLPANFHIFLEVLISLLTPWHYTSCLYLLKYYLVPKHRTVLSQI